MIYLQFDKTSMTNLEEALPREILHTNKSGAYHCTSIVNCNTRKYHGLLVVPIPELGKENHVLLSSLDETVIQHGAEFNLGLHEYGDAHFSPNGHKYIREFVCETIPATLYRVGGVILKKEKIFVHHENRILIRYTLLDAHSKTTLRFRPFLAFRKVTTCTHENDQVNRSYEEVQNGIKTSLYPGYPDLYMQLSSADTKFHYEPDWYRNIQYRKEYEWGGDFKEDLYVPGYFEIPMKKGESVVFSAGTAGVDTEGLLGVFQREEERRIPRNSFLNCLLNSAYQFYNKQGDDAYLVAGYPWYNIPRARDLFISLPGLTIAANRGEWFDRVMDTAIKDVYKFMRGESTDQQLEFMEDADTLLWSIWALQEYAEANTMKKCREKYGQYILDVFDFIKSGNHPNLYVHANGLLFTNGKKKPVTWMNAVVDGKPVTPRSGYIVEVNALWYNALCFANSLYDDANKQIPHIYEEIIDALKESFPKTFLNAYGYLYDYVDGDIRDLSVRPNMILAAALKFSPLDKRQMKSILDIVTRELLTNKGLRSLSPKSLGYNPIYDGTYVQRAYAYHQGTVWPWLMGFYSQAYLKLHKRSGVSFIERQLIGFESEMTNNCIASLSELYDGNPPFKGRSTISFAMSVGETLRVLKMLSNYYLD